VFARVSFQKSWILSNTDAGSYQCIDVIGNKIVLKNYNQIKIRFTNWKVDLRNVHETFCNMNSYEEKNT
jgi:hypothetical protein